MESTSSQMVEKKIIETYIGRTGRSKEQTDEAREYLPGGVTRNLAYFSPYPLYMERGQGCYLYDDDGNEYIDFLNTYSTLIHGHADPDIVSAAQDQLGKGTSLCANSSHINKLARLICDRIPAMDMIRFTCSGTEATLYALRAAMAFTDRDMIIKIEGAWHGGHDYGEVSASPDMEAKGLPTAHLDEKGIPASMLNHVAVASFNDLNGIECLLQIYRDKVAAIIVEPMIGAGGLIPPEDGYLKGLRELADTYNVLLIFDEVITFRLHRGGLQALQNVEPDLTCLGKIIGGGFPVGAFGGRREIMAQFEPGNPNVLGHSGTLTGNNMTMVAGIASIEKYDDKVINRIDELGVMLRNGFNKAFKKLGIKAQTTGMGSLTQIHWGDRKISNVKDVVTILKSAKKIPSLFHLEMSNRGIYIAPRNIFYISTPMTDKEIHKCIDEFEAALEVLKPYIAEEVPQLIESRP